MYKLRRLNDVRWWAERARANRSHRLLWAGGLACRSRLRGGGIRFLTEDALFEHILRELNLPRSQTLQQYVEELVANQEMRRQWEAARERYHVTKYRDWTDRVRSWPGNVALYYALIREFRPKIIVETGTASGSMTSYLLAALEANGSGTLISIDIPPTEGSLTMDLTINRSDVGYWIPDVLRYRWDYRIGDAKVLLPKVLAEQRVDVFVHDSLHTRTHMLFEYAVARCLMREGSLIISDDILWNNAFDDFLALNRLSGYAPFSNPNIGCFVNRFDDFERQVGTEIVHVASDGTSATNA